VLVVVFGYSFLAGKRGGGGADPSIADRADPGYWSERDAQHLIQNGWSTADRNELFELIQRYVQGECNLGFDKLRIIFLARLGRGAGWFDDATSWNYVFPAIGEIQSRYGSWSELKAAMDAGRAEWYGGPNEVPKAQHELARRGWTNLSQNFSQVAFR
jgi:hypothetical protein